MTSITRRYSRRFAASFEAASTLLLSTLMPSKKLPNAHGSYTWLGRSWRAVTDFLTSRPLVELRHDLEILQEQVADLRRDTARDRARLAERISNLEALLLEHPKAQTGDATVLTGKGAIFPSPLVSIVMPTWNRAGIVGQAIESVLAQSFTDWELIVADDGSTDNSEETVARFADPRICYQRKERAGQCATRNHALRLARG